MRKARRESAQTRWTRDSEKEKYWRSQLRRWQGSGLSVRAFCKENGVVETSFYAWRRELLIRGREEKTSDELEDTRTEVAIPRTVKDARGRNIPVRFRQSDCSTLQSLLQAEPEDNPFVPLTLIADAQLDMTEQSTGPTQQGITVTMPSGLRISITNANDIELLSKVVKTLEDHC